MQISSLAALRLSDCALSSLSVCLPVRYLVGLFPNVMYHVSLTVLISKSRVSGMSLGLFVSQLRQSGSLTSMMCSASVSRTVI